MSRHHEAVQALLDAIRSKTGIADEQIKRIRITPSLIEGEDWIDVKMTHPRMKAPESIVWSFGLHVEVDGDE